MVEFARHCRMTRASKESVQKLYEKNGPRSGSPRRLPSQSLRHLAREILEFIRVKGKKSKIIVSETAVKPSNYLICFRGPEAERRYAHACTQNVSRAKHFGIGY